MDQARKERVAENEANVRDLNERFGVGRFICECGNEDCREVLSLPLDIYNSVRADARRFIVAPGHEIPETEDVVVRKDEFFVVRKRDDTAHIVEARDPRGR